MELGFLKSLVIVLGVSALVVFLLHRLKIPSIVGFLVAGAIIGPYGIGVLKRCPFNRSNGRDRRGTPSLYDRY